MTHFVRMLGTVAGLVFAIFIAALLVPFIVLAFGIGILRLALFGEVTRKPGKIHLKRKA